MTADQSEDETDRDDLECPDCGSSDTHEDGDHRLHCFNCGEINDAFSIRFRQSGVAGLPEGWIRSPEDAEECGVDQLFLHRETAAFIGVEDGEAELVTAEIRLGEVPDPVTREATPEAIRELAEKHNDERERDAGTERGEV